MITGFKYTYINMIWDKKLNKKYLHPLSIILTLYFSWEDRTIIHITYNPEKYCEIRNNEGIIRIDDNFQYEKIRTLSKFDKYLFLIKYFSKILNKLYLIKPSLTFKDTNPLVNDFISNGYKINRVINEKTNKQFEVKISLLLGFDNFSVICNVKDKITHINYSMILIRVLPNLIRLNNIIGKVKWLSKKNNQLIYYNANNDLQFYINLSNKDFIIKSENKNSISNLINQIGENFKEREFLRKKALDVKL